MPLGFESLDALWIVLSVTLVVTCLVGAHALLRLAGALDRLSTLLSSTEKSAVPLMDKAGGTLDRVNLQLDKVDLVTDSAVSAADSADTAVRAVSKAITVPVQKVSSVATGVSHGASAFMAGNDIKQSMDAGRDAARRRSEELAEELARKDRRLATVGGPAPAMAPERPAATDPSAKEGPASAFPVSASPAPAQTVADATAGSGETTEEIRPS